MHTTSLSCASTSMESEDLGQTSSNQIRFGRSRFETGRVLASSSTTRTSCGPLRKKKYAASDSDAVVDLNLSPQVLSVRRYHSGLALAVRIAQQTDPRDWRSCSDGVFVSSLWSAIGSSLKLQ
jgi:hypothetical protein